MSLPKSEKPKFLATLRTLETTIEEMLLSGLTTTSESTQQTLEVSFQEAARLRLLRFGQTLRVTNEELGRYIRNEDGFSRKRLMFFLTRTWMLSRGLTRALNNDDEKEWNRLLWVPPNESCDSLEVVTLGVVKKVTPAFYAFDFRLRVLDSTGDLEAGEAISWSCVFPVKKDLKIPAESFLHLPQKQKFNASIFLEKKRLVLENALVSRTKTGTGRVALKPESKVTLGKTFTEWEPFFTWNPESTLQRLRDYEPTPFDLEVEVQEEVTLHDWKIGKSKSRKEQGQVVYPITSGPLEFEGVVATTEEGVKLRAELDKLIKKKKREPLFGLMHYDRCGFVLQPLSLLTPDGPRYLMVSEDKVDRASLVKSLHF